MGGRLHRLPGSTVAQPPVEPRDAAEKREIESHLSKEEKDFLKVARKVRAILKLEDQLASGGIDKLQAQKLASKEEELRRFAAVERSLAATSPLREKCADVLA